MKKQKKPKKIIEKPKLPWQKKEEFLKEKFPRQIVPKQEKLIKGWRRT
jgi:hypothetical protein